MIDIHEVAAEIVLIAEGVRRIAAESGRRADTDAVYELEEAAQHLRNAYRRLGQMRAEDAAKEVVAAKRRSRRLPVP